MSISVNDVRKYLEIKRANQDYGSLLIYFNNGEITAIKEHNDFNSEALKDAIDQKYDQSMNTIKPVIVRKYSDGDKKNVKKCPENVKNGANSGKNVPENDQIETRSDNDPDK